MLPLIRDIALYPVHFFLFYWICFTFPFTIDLVMLPFELVETDQPALIHRPEGCTFPFDHPRG